MKAFSPQRSALSRARLRARHIHSALLRFTFRAGHAIHFKSQISNLKSSLCVLSAICCVSAFTALPALAEAGDFLLVRRSMQVQPIRLAAINDQFVEHLPHNQSWEKVPLSECIALLNPASVAKARTTGVLVLADGQRLPGAAVHGAASAADTLAWNHPWLGRVDVPLQLVESVAFTPQATAPPAGGVASDVVLLANGDRQEGFVISLGDPITIEVDRAGEQQNTDIPRNLVAAVTMVAPKQSASGKRIWFDEGTVVDVQSIGVGDDGYVRLNTSALIGGTQPTQVKLSQIAAILLDPQGMIPLATLSPSRVEGPATRYTLPRPDVRDPAAPLGLSAIAFQGPLITRYTLPEGAQRFSAEAQLPQAAREWGDYELIIRSNDTEVFRTRMNAANHTAVINVPLSGRELTIELSQGAHGPIQDELVLNRAMLMLRR